MPSLIEGFFCGVLCMDLGIAGNALAQPMEQTRDGLFVTVPVGVTFYASARSESEQGRVFSLLGQFEVVKERRGPYRTEALARLACPVRVPVLTVFADGTRIDGYWLENVSDRPVDSILFENASMVEWEPDHGYRVTSSFGEYRASAFSIDGIFRPGQRKKRSQWSDTLKVKYIQGVQTRVGFNVVYQVPPSLPPGFPIGPLTTANDRVAARFQRVMGGMPQNSGDVNILLDFDVVNPDSVAETSQRVSGTAFLPAVTGGYIARATIDNEQDDLTIADNLPLGTSFPCQWNAGVGGISTTLVVSSLGRQLLLTNSNLPDDGTISFNPFSLFDFDASDGVVRSTYDYEAALTHETFHILGFISLLDTAAQGGPGATWMDQFRFGTNFVSPSQLQTGVRNFISNNSNTAAYFPTSLSFSAETYPGSRGRVSEGTVCDHWRSSLLLNNQIPIGIMDPRYTTGTQPFFSDYASNADWGMLDVMGWNIQRPVPQATPDAPGLLFPAPDAPLVPRNPTFSWNALPSGQTASLFLHQGTLITASSERYRVANLTTSTAVIPAGTLQGGTVYSWFVTAFNSDGFAMSPLRSFTTKCDADVDDGTGSGIPDGGVTIDDLLFYLSVFGSGDARADVDDGSGTGIPDGGVTIDDLLYFAARYEAGC